MIVVLGLPLNVATIILGCIFSMLLSDFWAHGPKSIPIPAMTTLIEFFHADTEMNFYLLQLPWYFISAALWCYMCFCTHSTFMVCSTANAVNSCSWHILFKVLTLNVTICIVLLDLNNFLFVLEFCSWFFEHWGQSSNLSRTYPFFTQAKGHMVLYTHIINMLIYTCTCSCSITTTPQIIKQTHNDKVAGLNDAHRKTQEDFFMKYFTSHLYL